MPRKQIDGGLEIAVTGSGRTLVAIQRMIPAYALVADTSLSGLRVGRELDAIIARRGKPVACASDNAADGSVGRVLRQPNGRVAGQCY